MEKKVTNFKRVNETMVFAGNRVRTYKGPKCPQKACNQLTEHIYDLAIQGINMSRPGLNMSVLIDTSKSSLIRIRIVYASKKHISTLFQIISIKKRKTNRELSYIVAYHYIRSTTNAFILFLIHLISLTTTFSFVSIPFCIILSYLTHIWSKK